jgi:hypothetical protein
MGAKLKHSRGKAQAFFDQPILFLDSNLNPRQPARLLATIAGNNAMHTLLQTTQFFHFESKNTPNWGQSLNRIANRLKNRVFLRKSTTQTGDSPQTAKANSNPTPGTIPKSKPRAAGSVIFNGFIHHQR